MGWEVRRGRLYLYRNEWRDGRRVKVYLAKEGTPAAVLLEHGLGKWYERRAREREVQRRATAELRARVTDLLRATAETNGELRVVADGLLTAVGFYNHHRGCWRMARKQLPKATTDDALKLLPGDRPGVPTSTSSPLVVHAAPSHVPGSIDLFARARAGDTAARKRIRESLVSWGWVDHLGDLGKRATQVLIAKFTGGDAPWQIGVEEKVQALSQELLGPNPTLLDRLLVRRVVNGWLCVHALELELAISPPARLRDRAYLESAIGKASRRFTSAIAELARVRRLQLPNVIVSITPPTTPPPLQPRVATADVLETASGSDGPSGKPANNGKPATAKSKRGKSKESASRRGSRGRSQQNGDSR